MLQQQSRPLNRPSKSQLLVFVLGLLILFDLLVQFFMAWKRDDVLLIIFPMSATTELDLNIWFPRPNLDFTVWLQDVATGANIRLMKVTVSSWIIRGIIASELSFLLFGLSIILWRSKTYDTISTIDNESM